MLQNPLLTQLRKKLNEINYEVTTNYDQDHAKTLARLQDILEKREINSDYPSMDITPKDIWELTIKNL